MAPDFCCPNPNPNLFPSFQFQTPTPSAIHDKKRSEVCLGKQDSIKTQPKPQLNPTLHSPVTANCDVGPDGLRRPNILGFFSVEKHAEKSHKVHVPGVLLGSFCQGRSKKKNIFKTLSPNIYRVTSFTLLAWDGVMGTPTRWGRVKVLQHG